MVAACCGKPVDRPPVWLMRQAGRYLPEYRQLKASHSFWEMVRTPALATEVTLQPVRRFGMDAAILFSDILIALDAMGINVKFDDQGLSLSPLISQASDLSLLKPVNADQAFDYVAQTIDRLCRALHPHTAVLGFAGAPFTLAAYLIAGTPATNVDALKLLASREPRLYADIAHRITEVVTSLLRLQIKAGADAVQLFDSWSLHLTEQEYVDWALPYAKKVIEQLSDLNTPVILYVRQASAHLPAAAQSGCQVLSIDSSIDLFKARSMTPSSMALQGNFHPSLLQAPAATIHQTVTGAMSALKGTGYLVNLGQGLTPDSPVEGITALVDAVRQAS